MCVTGRPCRHFHISFSGFQGLILPIFFVWKKKKEGVEEERKKEKKEEEGEEEEAVGEEDGPIPDKTKGIEK